MIWSKILYFVKSKLTNANDFNKENNGIVGKIIYGIVIVIVLIMYFYKHNQVAYLQQEVNLRQITIAEQQMYMDKQNLLMQQAQDLIHSKIKNKEQLDKLEQQIQDMLKEADTPQEQQEVLEGWFG